jgi:hypothetical protein
MADQNRDNINTALDYVVTVGDAALEIGEIVGRSLDDFDRFAIKTLTAPLRLITSTIDYQNSVTVHLIFSCLGGVNFEVQQTKGEDYRHAPAHYGVGAHPLHLVLECAQAHLFDLQSPVSPSAALATSEPEFHRISPSPCACPLPVGLSPPRGGRRIACSIFESEDGEETQI